MWCGLRRGKLFLAGLTWLAFLGGAGAAAASNNVTYNGGPVAHSMTGVIVDWGAAVNSMYTNQTSGDPGFIKYLAGQSGSTSDVGGVLAQYMDSSGQNAANRYGYGNQYEITPSVTSPTIYDSQIQTELVNQIEAGHLPTPAGNGVSTIYLVLFPAPDTECIDAQTCSANAPDQTTAAFCAYHSGTQLPDGTTVLYAVIPDDTSGPMSTECGAAPNVFDDQTSYLSHEWAETVTDPFGSAWWVNNSSSPDNGNEVGDNCNQVMATEGGWTVQQEWSNLDGNCMPGEPAYSAPTASFVAPSQSPPGQPVSFDASSSSDPSADATAITGTTYSISSGIASYRWSWGDGNSTTSATPTAAHTYANLGNYQVSLTVTDNLGFTSTVTRSVSISSGGVDPAATTGGTQNVSDAGATLDGTINPENQSVQYQFAYGTSASSLTDTTPLAPGPAGQTATAVSATVAGLSPATTYYYRLEVISGSQTYLGSVQSFATNASGTPAQTPTVATGSASGVAVHGAVLGGTIDPGGPQAVTYHFSYGTSAANLPDTTPASAGPSGTTSVPISATLAALAPGTTYFFRLEATLDGQTYSGAVRSFTTRLPAPGASTGSSTAITSAGATVSGLVVPNGVRTTYHVEFGTTAAYGHSTASFSAGAGAAAVRVRLTISGLRARTRYHYRLVAMSAGGTSVGTDRAFLTAAPPKRAPAFRFKLPARAAARAALAGSLKVRFRCSRRCSARFTVIVAAGRLARFTPVSVALGSGRASTGARRWGTARLAFNASLRRRLGRRGHLRLVVFGYAVSAGSAPTAPRGQVLTLTLG